MLNEFLRRRLRDKGKVVLVCWLKSGDDNQELVILRDYINTLVGRLLHFLTRGEREARVAFEKETVVGVSTRIGVVVAHSEKLGENAASRPNVS